MATFRDDLSSSISECSCSARAVTYFKVHLATDGRIEKLQHSLEYYLCIQSAINEAKDIAIYT